MQSFTTLSKPVKSSYPKPKNGLEISNFEKDYSLRFLILPQIIKFSENFYFSTNILLFIKVLTLLRFLVLQTWTSVRFLIFDNSTSCFL